MERIVEKKLWKQETPSTPENNTPNISREQDLIQEISTSIKEQAQSIISPEINHTIKISENNKVLPEIEILDTKANDKNFFNDDDFFNNNEDNREFCSFSDDDDE
ncbi:4948_t:CDS:2, partial [Racocetra persica]